MATETVQAADHKLLVAGEWLETGEWSEVRSPYDDTVVGRVPTGDAALVDRAVLAAQEAFEAAEFPRHERAAVLDRASQHRPRARRRSHAGDRRRGGQAAEDGEGGGNAMRRDPDVLRRRGAQVQRRDGADGRLGDRRRKARRDPPRPLRGRWRDQSLQLSPQPRRPQARPGAGRRQPRGPEAGRADADLGPAPGRDPRRRRAPRWLAQRRSAVPARRSETRSSSTTRCARSPSPGRPGSAGTSGLASRTRRSTSSSAQTHH